VGRYYCSLFALFVFGGMAMLSAAMFHVVLDNMDSFFGSLVERCLFTELLEE